MFQLEAPSRDFSYRESSEPGPRLPRGSSCARDYEHQAYGKPFGAMRFVSWIDGGDRLARASWIHNSMEEGGSVIKS